MIEYKGILTEKQYCGMSWSHLGSLKGKHYQSQNLEKIKQNFQVEKEKYTISPTKKCIYVFI